ncbi:MAG: hypothetical protein HY860_05195 [Chlamydiales bacterium]|nr:hypothetical protein [Chlamydiales bacterium]
MRSFFLLSFIIFSCSCYAITQSELEQCGQEKLESSFEHMGIGLVEIGFGVFEFSRGDPVGGAVSIGAGVKELRDSVNDFNEAKGLFEKSREIFHD